MSDLVADRIERALQRIETAGRAKAFAAAQLERRNARLRGSIESAIADIDALIAQEQETDIPDTGDVEDEG